MTLIIIIYQSLSLPYTMAFSSSESSWFDTFTNCIFGCDILIQFNTPVSANDEETEYITERIEIARIYVRGWYVTLSIGRVLLLWLTCCPSQAVL